jgi:hypothetical protein
MAAKSESLRARAASGWKQRGNNSNKTYNVHSCLGFASAVAAKWQALCARAAPGRKKRGNDFKIHGVTLVYGVWDRNGREMTCAVRARRAWPKAARERLEHTYILRSCLESRTAVATK